MYNYKKKYLVNIKIVLIFSKKKRCTNIRYIIPGILLYLEPKLYFFILLFTVYFIYTLYLFLMLIMCAYPTHVLDLLTSRVYILSDILLSILLFWITIFPTFVCIGSITPDSTWFTVWITTVIVRTDTFA